MYLTYYRTYYYFYNLVKFCISIHKSYRYLKLNKFKILISTGGYMSLPLCIASTILGIKIFIFEPNSVLGRANKITILFAKKSFVTTKFKRYI